eukprot:CAMPEP_0172655254 /NCGR_PEP_ID=MMETSP1074-20121228/517_1 /TAXON_ID=2916 /ORGANISM="Ceratium fusus, Strain PA161109" /LENGTH=150 /DNA_ID=CAMNT_0013469835 /DNA_START=20 /DNA_END=472 /DNA_ORIENTATION=+
MAGSTDKTWTTGQTIEAKCDIANQMTNSSKGKDAYQKAFEKKMNVKVSNLVAETFGCRRLTSNNRRLQSTGVNTKVTYTSPTAGTPPTPADFTAALVAELKSAGFDVSASDLTVKAFSSPQSVTTPTVSAAVGAPATLFFVAILSVGMSW